ncbi:IS4 family transposase [Massilia dura]|uniref:IS4 family transposase n=1 Tax=Pseudoduganella dura TaxID=321982 RepID=A0A6I3XHY6_9BURK|nr:IS4 family transposase [Pseudoduganella dura]MUI15116.1 IS4 family transposase [Pseudoduganella dura]
MHARQIIQRLLGQECPSIHAKRRACLAQIVQAVARAGLGVVRIGKQLRSQTSLRHRIKCCDRLLSNPHLAKERVQIYRAMSQRLLQSRQYVQVAVDWSEIRADGSAQLLRAAAIIEGRAFTLYEEVHPQERLAASLVHKCFMKTLKTILPAHCRAIIITDAGFRATWFKTLNQLGFGWVGRIRNRDLVCQQNGNDWFGCKSLYSRATAKARDLGYFFHVRSNPVDCRLVLYKSKSKGRHCLTKSGQPARARHSKKNSAAQCEPWLLAVSPALAQLRADDIIKIYSGRMQIEQTFRDLKNAKWGMALRHSQTTSLLRLAALLLIGALLTYALWLIGLAARAAGYEVHYGSHPKAGSCLSIFSLAMHWVDDYRRPRLSPSAIKYAFIELVSMVRTWEFEG